MTDRSKFEQVLEYLLAEDKEKAAEIFHQIVVEKSREIYENILSEDFNADEEEYTEEDFAFGEADNEVGGDAADDFLDDVDASDDEEGEEDDMDFGDEEDDMEFDSEEGDIEDRVVDLEDALDDLKAEFEKLMSDEEGSEFDDEEGEEDDMDFGDEEDDMDFGDEEDEEDLKDSYVREYVEKVGGSEYTKYGKMGDDGANTKSIVAKKNDMGGTTANIVKGGEAKGEGTKGGLANPSVKEEDFGNINVPGGNAGKSAFKKREPGHGAEKKGTGDNGDASAKSPLNGAPKRAK